MIDASKLTDEQLNMAADAFAARPGAFTVDGLRAAAPYLQVPWDVPTECEWRECMRLDNNRLMDDHLSACVFVEKRNAALLPTTPDPRREAILKILNSVLLPKEYLEATVLEILKAIDGIKP